MRKDATNPESLIWSFLRDRRMKDFKFRRQHPVGNYILDFYCHEAHLAVELDGSGHLEDQQIEHDSMRTKFLQDQGITVLRFWNSDVLNNLEAVLRVIWENLPEND
jgi:very-short-patch-repair endonuclease